MQIVNYRGNLSKEPSITYSGLISHCFALHPYEKQGLIKPELVNRFGDILEHYKILS